MWPKCACGEEDEWLELQNNDIVCKWCKKFVRRVKWQLSNGKNLPVSVDQ
jgi:hypothetical protein